MTFRYHLTRFSNTLWIYVICVILTGAYLYQYIKHLNPCPLCELQRLFMISVTIGPLLNLKFGMKAGHYGWSLISAFIGAGIALRQISLHVCPSFTQWGIPVFGLQLYTWAFLVFAFSIFGLALLLTLYRPRDTEITQRLSLFEGIAFIYIALIALANTITAVMQHGLKSLL